MCKNAQMQKKKKFQQMELFLAQADECCGLLSSRFCFIVEKENDAGEETVMELSVLRDQLDEIDAGIVKLYEERMKICARVAEYKLQAGKKVLDRQREEEKIARVKALTHSEFNSKGIEELFEQIMSMSRKLQYGMLAEQKKEPFSFLPVDCLKEQKIRVVFQGAEGAYSQAAMFEYFGTDIENFHVDTFRDAMSAIEEKKADFAVLPIENSTAGMVSEIYDLLVEFENYIVGEQIIPIEHCLLGLPGSSPEDIRTVYSHPQSLMQSTRYLEAHPWQQVSMQNNAFAARKVAKEQDPTQAAVASACAGSIYGLSVLEKGINNEKNNSTRFIIVTNRKIFLRDAKKISLCLEVPHVSGALYRMLSHIIYNNLNMTKIESRPVPDRPWEYRFFIDFDGNLAENAVQNALAGLKEEAGMLKILGNYGK